MRGKNIVITGGAGFIGSNLARKLTENKSNNVIVIDDLSSGHIENIQDLIDKNRITFIKGNIMDLDLLQETFRKVDFVFHKAAVISALKNKISYIESNITNVEGTLTVLIAARDNNVRKVIFDSSASVYGNQMPFLKKHEEMVTNPLSFYAVSKLAGEYYCRVFTESYKLSTIILRYFNIYGPRQDSHSKYSAVIPRFIIQALKDESLIIFGDGKQTRDFIFVNDVINANILAAENNCNGIYNIASGNSISINNLAKLIMKLVVKDLKIINESKRPEDVYYSNADVSKSIKQLNFKPIYDLKDGLEETIQWYISNEMILNNIIKK